MRLTQLFAGLWLLAGTVQAQIALLAVFDHPPVREVSQAMEGELVALFAGAGAEIAVHPDGALVYLGSTRHVLYVAFRGRCEWVPQLAPRSHRTVLASLAMVDGTIQPLMTVDCDAVAQAITVGMAGSDRKQASFVYGRALGRVVAHEVFHWVAHQLKHRHSELFSESMGARTLLADMASFDSSELRLLRVNR